MYALLSQPSPGVSSSPRRHPFCCCCTVRRRRCSENRERQASISGYLCTFYIQSDISYAQPNSPCPDSPPWLSSESPRLSMLVMAAPFDRIANTCGSTPTAAMVPVIPSRQVTYTSPSESNASKNVLTLSPLRFLFSLGIRWKLGTLIRLPHSHRDSRLPLVIFLLERWWTRSSCCQQARTSSFQAGDRRPRLFHRRRSCSQRKDLQRPQPDQTWAD